MSELTNTMRIDKWLWCSRFFKTRSMAADAVKAGKIKLNGDKTKPSKMIHLKDKLMIRKQAFEYQITVLDIPKTRLPASKAILLYAESEESIEKRELIHAQLKADAAHFPKTQGRPTKRDRRDLMKFKQKG